MGGFGGFKGSRGSLCVDIRSCLSTLIQISLMSLIHPIMIWLYYLVNRLYLSLIGNRYSILDEMLHSIGNGCSALDKMLRLIGNAVEGLIKRLQSNAMDSLNIHLNSAMIDAND